MDLSDADVGLLLSTVAELREPSSLDSLRLRALALVTSLVSADSTSWNEINLASGTRALAAYPDVPVDDLRPAFDAYLHEHPVIRHHARTGDGRPWAISDFVTREEFIAGPLYQHVFRPLGVEDQMSFVLPDPEILLGIAANGAWGAFTERHRHLLNLLRPHLVRARRDAIAYDRTRWYLATVDSLLEQDGEGLLLVGGTGRVEYLTPNAAQIAGRWFGAGQSGVLPEAIGEWLDSDTAHEPFELEAPTRRLRARRLPGPDAATTAVLLRESGVNAIPRTRLTGLGLTDRQAEVLQLAMDGRPNAKIAAQLHISPRTVEQHVHAALNKLGAANRTQAARLLRDH